MERRPQTKPTTDGRGHAVVGDCQDNETGGSRLTANCLLCDIPDDDVVLEAEVVAGVGHPVGGKRHDIPAEAIVTGRQVLDVVPGKCHIRGTRNAPGQEVSTPGIDLRVIGQPLLGSAKVVRHR